MQLSIQISATSIGSVNVAFLRGGVLIESHTYANWKHAIASLRLDFVCCPVYIVHDGPSPYADEEKPKAGTIPAARCWNHRNATAVPVLCHTCQRIAVEHDIVTRTVDALLAAGYQLSEQEDGQIVDAPSVAKVFTREDLLSLLFDLDDAFLVTEKDGRSSFVRFVFGNDGHDVISDYGVSLEDVLAPINAYADTLQP